MGLGALLSANPVYAVVVVLGGLVCIAVLALTALLAKTQWQYGHIPGPKRSSLIFGNLAQLKKHESDGKYIGDLFLKWAREYGPIFCIYIFTKPVIYISGKDGLRKILGSIDNFPKPPELYHRVAKVFGQRTLGNGLVTVTDQRLWAIKRKVMNPAFSRKFLGQLCESFNEIADRVIDNLHPKADGETVVCMADMVTRLTLDVVTEVGFGLKVNAIENMETPFAKAVGLLLKGLVASSELPFLSKLPTTKELKKGSVEAIKSLRKTAEELYLNRKGELERGEEVPKNMLSLITENSMGNPDIDIEDIKDEFITFFVAGQDTTGKQLSFFIRELAKNPAIYERCVKEIEEEIGAKPVLDADDLGKPAYLNSALKEILRLYPPVVTIARSCKYGSDFYGYPVPQGALILTNIYASHRLEENFDQPDKFIPDRFMNADDSTDNVFAYLPFSLGARNCIGQVFSQLEARIFLIKFLRTYRMIPAPHMTDEMEEVATLRPKGGVPVKLVLN